MFKELFTRRGIIAGYRTAPLHDERLRYLMHCAQGGARQNTLRAIAAHQVNVVHSLQLREGERVSQTRIEAAAARWSLPGGRRCSRPARADASQRFLSHTVRWLRFVDMLEEPDATRPAHAGEVAVFAAWMRKECGHRLGALSAYSPRIFMQKIFLWLQRISHVYENSFRIPLWISMCSSVKPTRCWRAQVAIDFLFQGRARRGRCRPQRRVERTACGIAGAGRRVPRVSAASARRVAAPRSALAALALALAVLLGTGSAQGQTTITLVKNTVKSSGPGTAGITSNDNALAFTSGAHTHGYTVKEVKIRFATAETPLPTYTAAIYTANSSGEPDTPVGTLSKPSILLPASPDNSFTADPAI